MSVSEDTKSSTQQSIGKPIEPLVVHPNIISTNTGQDNSGSAKVGIPPPEKHGPTPPHQGEEASSQEGETKAETSRKIVAQNQQVVPQQQPTPQQQVAPQQQAQPESAHHEPTQQSGQSGQSAQQSSHPASHSVSAVPPGEAHPGAHPGAQQSSHLTAHLIAHHPDPYLQAPGQRNDSVPQQVVHAVVPQAPQALSQGESAQQQQEQHQQQQQQNQQFPQPIALAPLHPHQPQGAPAPIPAYWGPQWGPLPADNHASSHQQPAPPPPPHAVISYHQPLAPQSSNTPIPHAVGGTNRGSVVYVDHYAPQYIYPPPLPYGAPAPQIQPGPPPPPPQYVYGPPPPGMWAPQPVAVQPQFAGPPPPQHTVVPLTQEQGPTYATTQPLQAVSPRSIPVSLQQNAPTNHSTAHTLGPSGAPQSVQQHQGLPANPSHGPTFVPQLVPYPPHPGYATPAHVSPNTGPPQPPPPSSSQSYIGRSQNVYGVSQPTQLPHGAQPPPPPPPPASAPPSSGPPNSTAVQYQGYAYSHPHQSSTQPPTPTPTSGSAQAPPPLPKVDNGHTSSSSSSMSSSSQSPEHGPQAGSASGTAEHLKAKNPGSKPTETTLGDVSIPSLPPSIHHGPSMNTSQATITRVLSSPHSSSIRKRGSSLYSHPTVSQQNAPVVGATVMSFDPGFGSGQSRWQPGFSQDVKRRTRTGCLTCRRRRVKCDEQRPQCRNCMRSERVCLGYDSIFTRNTSRKIEELALRRKVFRGSRKMRISSLLEGTRAGTGTLKSDHGGAGGSGSSSSSNENVDATSTRASSSTITSTSTTDTNDSVGSSDQALNRIHENTNTNKPDKMERFGRAPDATPTPVPYVDIELDAVNWVQVTELFRDNLGGSLDLMLGTTDLRMAADRTANFFRSSNGSLIHVASEVEVMRQLLMIVYPSFNSHTLNILDCNLPLEKLRTTDDYSIMRAVAEVLSSGNEKPQTLHKVDSMRQQPEHPQRMSTTFRRIFNLGKLLARHAKVYSKQPRGQAVEIPLVVITELLRIDAIDERMTDAVWILVHFVLQDEMDADEKIASLRQSTNTYEGSQLAQQPDMTVPYKEKMESSTGDKNEASEITPLVLVDGGTLRGQISHGEALSDKLSRLLRHGDPRAAIALLALSVNGCMASRQILGSIDVQQGLALALVELSLLSSANI